MKIGDKVKIKGGKKLQCWTIESISGSNFLIGRDFYTNNSKSLPIESVILTSMSPKLFKTAYGPDWTNNIEALLREAKITYHICSPRASESIRSIYVDAKKIKRAEEAYIDFYKKLAG